MDHFHFFNFYFEKLVLILFMNSSVLNDDILKDLGMLWVLEAAYKIFSKFVIERGQWQVVQFVAIVPVQLIQRYGKCC